VKAHEEVEYASGILAGESEDHHRNQRKNGEKADT
jgi:hypothetical protein